jgi:predicted NUDIX family NTP pyrophosphohydrolase
MQAVSEAKMSAGLLLYRVCGGRLQVLVAHMGGPFWASKDEGAWSIIKGECDEGEDAYAAARREFNEETGAPAPDGPAIELGEVRHPSGKWIAAWAVEGGFDPSRLSSNTFTLEWPPGSGQRREYPEIDRAGWFDATTARLKLVKGQVPFIDVLERRLHESGRTHNLERYANPSSSAS